MANQYTGERYRENRTCPTCTEVFNTKKSRKKIYCSRNCAHKANARQEGEIWERLRNGKPWLVKRTAAGYEWLNEVGKPEKKKKDTRRIGDVWDIKRGDTWYTCTKVAKGEITQVRNENLSPYIDKTNGKGTYERKPKQHVTDKQLKERKAKEARLSATLNLIPRPNEIKIKEKPIALDGKIAIKVDAKTTIRIPPNKYTPAQIYKNWGVVYNG